MMVEHDPEIQVTNTEELARDLLVIPNNNVPLVPNVGIIGGTHSVLVVETGLGPSNAKTVLDFATEYAKGRQLYLTTTHFHPEHAFGAHTFAEQATFLINQAQADDLKTKGPAYLEMFKALGAPVARRLENTVVPEPDLTYDHTHDLDLGGRVVHLRATGRAHSKGDQVIRVPDADVLFTGDLVETGQFAIFPWFPPHDTDVSGTRWLTVMQNLAETAPRTVVPGHGDIGDTNLLTDVRDYLHTLRDETWKRRDSAMSEETIIEEVSALLITQYPTWTAQEWIEKGISCLCSEHPTP
ncbi:MBL fold metallo-hydrolase [Actinomadura meridiana]|uniref:MBL fold metallo-hydrolase n=1 Tax=Actinomadura meridiana TaxID=559626 RepID=A0ABP8BTZ5_9ACTN